VDREERTSLSAEHTEDSARRRGELDKEYGLQDNHIEGGELHGPANTGPTVGLPLVGMEPGGEL